MARNGQTPLGIPPTTLVALIVAVGGLVIVNRSPFQDTRPAPTPVPVYWHGPAASQDIPARLWEDPLGAVARWRSTQGAPDSQQRSPACFGAALPAGKSVQVLVLGAFVSGASYDEDVEQRRRTRYAVLAGLHRVGFVPQDPEHLGYFDLPADAPNSTVTGGPSPHLSSTPGSTTTGTPRSPVAVYEWLQPENATTTSTDARDERFVALLWLDPDAFRDEPLHAFSQMVANVTLWLKQGGVCSQGVVPAVTAAILGPADSDGLRVMSQEVASCAQGRCIAPEPDSEPNRKLRLAIYSPRATASDHWVLGQAETCVPNAPNTSEPPEAQDELARHFFAKSGGTVFLYRTLADDCRVIRRLFRELKNNRGVQNVGEIALVLERDTLYSRLMGRYFGTCASATSSPDTGTEFHPSCFTYLRGLDGVTPQTRAKPSGDSGGSGDAQSASSTSTAVTTETAAGQSQLDYLRRLAKRAASSVRGTGCHATRLSTKGCTRAIGVLGTDFYDKILVLQALRASFPRAVFFTTDLDARLLDQEHLRWTRHLIIGSSFGLALRYELQADTPPFRDTYQTSTYLATILAVSRELGPHPELPEPGSLATHWSRSPTLNLADGWASQQRIFEIGVSDAFDLDAPARPPPPRGETAEADRCKSLISCLTTYGADISPVAQTVFFSNTSRLTGLEAACYLLLALIVAAWVARGAPFSTASAGIGAPICRIPPQALIGVGLALALMLLITIAWPKLIPHDSSPIPLFGGASILESWLVEAAVILTVICLTIRGQRKLDQNSDEITEMFALPHSPATLADHRRRQLKDLPWCVRLRERLEFHTQNVSRFAGPIPGEISLWPVEQLFARYLFKGRLSARVTRVALATLAATLALGWVDLNVGTAYTGIGALAPRGGDSRLLSDVFSWVSLLSLQFLVFWSADAMFLSRAFIRELDQLRPAWPANALARGQKELCIAAEPAVTWMNLQLVARRTTCVANLVWYPSLVIAAMAVASFTVEFGPISFASNLVSLLASAAFVIAAAVLLRTSAESLRSGSIAWFTNYRSCIVKSDGPESAAAEQLQSLITRAEDLSEGALAPYSQQPLVRALLVPALSYGGTLLVQFLQRAS